jgi:hypothetical protein
MTSLLRPRRSDGRDGTGLILADTGFRRSRCREDQGFRKRRFWNNEVRTAIGKPLRGAPSSPMGRGQQISEF